MRTYKVLITVFNDAPITKLMYIIVLY